MASRLIRGILLILSSSIVVQSHEYGPKRHRRARALGYDNAVPQDLIPKMKADALALHAYGKAAKTLKNNKKTTYWFPKGARPRNALEVAILELQNIVKPGSPPFSYAGAEWWVQVVSAGESGTIGFHLDKDEGVASNKMYLVHPEWSSVFYLTNSGGCTLLLDQWSPNGNKYDPPVPRGGEMVCPKVNRFWIFDGDLLHGVLPGKREHRDASETKRITFLVNWWDRKPALPNCLQLDYEAVTGMVLLNEHTFHAMQRNLQSSRERSRRRRRLALGVVVVEPGNKRSVQSHEYTIRLPGDRQQTIRLPNVVPRHAAFSLRLLPQWRYSGYYERQRKRRANKDNASSSSSKRKEEALAQDTAPSNGRNRDLFPGEFSNRDGL